MASPLLTPSAISTSSSSSHRSATPRMGTLGGSLTPSPSIQSDEIDYFTCRAKAEGSGPAPTPVEEAEICYIRAVVSISPAVSKRFSLPARRKPSALDMSGPEPRPWSALHIPRRKALTPRELTDSHDRPHIDGLPLAPSSALPDPFSPRDVSTSFPSIDGLFPTSHLVPPTLSIDRPSTLLAASHGSNTSSDFTAPQAQRSPSPTLPVISPCQPLSIEHATATDELELRRSATGTLSKKSSSSYTDLAQLSHSTLAYLKPYHNPSTDIFSPTRPSHLVMGSTQGVHRALKLPSPPSPSQRLSQPRVRHAAVSPPSAFRLETSPVKARRCSMPSVDALRGIREQVVELEMRLTREIKRVEAEQEGWVFTEETRREGTRWAGMDIEWGGNGRDTNRTEKKRKATSGRRWGWFGRRVSSQLND